MLLNRFDFEPIRLLSVDPDLRIDEPASKMRVLASMVQRGGKTTRNRARGAEMLGIGAVRRHRTGTGWRSLNLCKVVHFQIRSTHY
jgi:hypothetical protein